MKHQKLFLCSLFMLLSVVILAQKSTNPTSQKIVIPLGGNIYQVAGENSERIDRDGIKSWSRKSSEFAVYFSSTNNKLVDLCIIIQKQDGKSKISVNNGSKKYKICINENAEGEIKVGKIELVKGYNCIKFVGISKKGANFSKISDLIIKCEEGINLNYVKENSNGRFYFGRRGPSVHMSYLLPENKNIKWFYNEVTVPKGEDQVGSYFMANGFGEGYFGMQVNSETERRILFSVWSSFVTDDPKHIPLDEQIILAKKGESVHTGEFGNEGSGGQSYMLYNWKAGETYKFLNSVEPDGKGKTTYTAYFFDTNTQKWLLIAQFIRPKTTTWYSSPYSFLENFIPEMGYVSRKVNFGNQWACDDKGQWFELTSARFTGDDIAGIEYRLDREGGVENNAFYLKNCGFFSTSVPLNIIFERKPSNLRPTVDFNSLPE